MRICVGDIHIAVGSAHCGLASLIKSELCWQRGMPISLEQASCRDKNAMKYFVFAKDKRSPARSAVICLTNGGHRSGNFPCGWGIRLGLISAGKNSTEGFSVYVEDTCSGLLVAVGMIEHALNVTGFHFRQRKKIAGRG